MCAGTPVRTPRPDRQRRAVEQLQRHSRCLFLPDHVAIIRSSRGPYVGSMADSVSHQLLCQIDFATVGVGATRRQGPTQAVLHAVPLPSGRSAKPGRCAARGSPRSSRPTVGEVETRRRFDFGTSVRSPLGSACRGHDRHTRGDLGGHPGRRKGDAGSSQGPVRSTS